MSRTDPLYDEHLGSQGQQQDNSKLSAVQEQINGAVREMTRNMEGLGQRGENLNTLQDKSDNLVDQSKGFSRGANRVRKQMWWKDMKMRMCIIVGIIVLLLIIIVPSVVYSRRN